MKNLIKKRLIESLEFDLIENLIKDDYPQSFNMDEFKSLNKFTERVKYCDQHLKKISAGSGRIVYMIDNTKVLKLAKNQKGVAQCEVEIQWGGDYYFNSILADVIDSHDNGLWVEMELANKCSKSQFKSMIGVDIDSFGRYLKNRELENKGRSTIFRIEPEIKEILNKNEFAQSVFEFMDASDSGAGDLGRTSSYGIVKRDGHDTIVIVDFGLTNDVYSTYYS